MVSITNLFFIVLPFVGWIIGIKARLPIMVFLSGILFIAVALFLASLLPVWLILSFCVLGLILMLGSVMTAW